jgi:two-component system sensor histidine kinase/response regulator
MRLLDGPRRARMAEAGSGKEGDMSQRPGLANSLMQGGGDVSLSAAAHRHQAIDAAELLQRVRGLGALAQIVELYQQSYPDKLRELEAALSQSCGTTARRAVHSLKGNFLNFGAAAGAQMAQSLAHAVEQGRWEQLRNGLPALRECCARVEADLRALLLASEQSQQADRSALGDGYRVLVADADPANRALCSTILRGDGFTVEEYGDGLEVLEALARSSVDVVVMGVVMPGLDGFQTCRRLKEQESTGMLPVLLLTALDEGDARLRGIDAGADDFLRKPVDPAELSLRARNAARGKHWYDQLQASFGQLQQLERLRDGLIHTLVHDMRTPLAAIKGYADLLAGGFGAPLTPRQKAVADKLVTQSQRLIGMVGSMLTLSRLESEQLPLELSQLDLRDLLASQAEQFAGLPDHQLELELPEAALPCAGDRELLERVLTNLLDNAFRFGPSGVPVRLSLRFASGSARVEVWDGGPGMPARWLEQLSENLSPFGPGRRRPSSGLGLAFCQLVMTKHGGELGAFNPDGGGATVWFSLPLS